MDRKMSASLLEMQMMRNCQSFKHLLWSAQVMTQCCPLQIFTAFLSFLSIVKLSQQLLISKQRVSVSIQDFKNKSYFWIILDDLSHLSNEVVKTNKISVQKGSEKRLPEFTEHPVDSFVVKNRPAILNCSVIHSDKVRGDILQNIFIFSC